MAEPMVSAEYVRVGGYRVSPEGFEPKISYKTTA